MWWLLQGLCVSKLKKHLTTASISFQKTSIYLQKIFLRVHQFVVGELTRFYLYTTMDFTCLDTTTYCSLMTKKAWRLDIFTKAKQTNTLKVWQTRLYFSSCALR